MTENRQGKRPAFDRRAIPAAARENRWHAQDGHSLRRIDWPPATTMPRGSLLFLPGRGDAYEKYLETLDGWSSRGWQVTAIDWRGQAGSGRLGLDSVTGHVDDFATWVRDLGGFWNEWVRRSPGPHVLVGHSMGGHLALRAVAEDMVGPDALVLTAPMLGLHPGFLPSFLLHGIARLMTALGDPRRPAWKWSEKPGALPGSRHALLTHDPVRYSDEQWWRENRPELVMGPGSWGWIERALASIEVLDKPDMLERVTLPVLILSIARDRLVEPGAIVRAARRMPHTELLTFGPEAYHEILREEDFVRDRAIAAIDDFLDRTVPATA